MSLLPAGSTASPWLHGGCSAEFLSRPSERGPSVFAIASVAIAAFIGSSAVAQGAINLAAELPGKTCIGSFSIPHPKGSITDQGAVRITFANGTAQVQTTFGVPAYRSPAEAKFADAETVASLNMTANAMTFARRSSDWKFSAVRREGPAIVLSGEADPRRARPDWTVAMASVTCQ